MWIMGLKGLINQTTKTSSYKVQTVTYYCLHGPWIKEVYF